jgi:low affinity Fe/Cu permease
MRGLHAVPKRPKSIKHSGGFQKFARHSSRLSGRPATFGLAMLIIVLWLVTGPLFHFSNAWQLVINTTTTIVTFLMVFLIQNTQNRDSEAMQIKLDELIRATKNAHTVVLDIEELSEKELDELKNCYTKLAQEALEKMRSGRSDLGSPDIKPEVNVIERKND